VVLVTSGAKARLFGLLYVAAEAATHKSRMQIVLYGWQRAEMGRNMLRPYWCL
jgi:hypothetical protein